MQDAANDLNAAIESGSVALLRLLQRRLKKTPGYDLFTILTPRPDGQFLERIYSTNEVQYPLGAADKVENNIWFGRLFGEKKPILANTLEEISQWLPDYQIFTEQNYASLLNLPVIFRDKTIGLINMMGSEHSFNDEAIAIIHREMPLAALAILGFRADN